MLKIIITFLFTSVTFVTCYSQDCSMLLDGKYQLKYDENFEVYENYQFEIIGDNFIRIENNVSVKQKIEKHSECRFSLKRYDTINEDSTAEFSKTLNSQKLFYDITRVYKDTSYFTLRVDLHIIISSGRFIKI